ncbi:MAG TPA: NUDIX domain-containing protein [Cryomorphaceae bacterium]|nr:NUDIX domain-containing protein [Cryomorphaceae bacterium]
MSFPFNVRVYGILICDGHILLSHETIKDFSFTKLPGGGLEFGEGTADCVVREFLEETTLNVEVIRHVYTTDFFQASAFDENHQVISIYYLLEAEGLDKPRPIEAQEANQEFEWVRLRELDESHFTFPIDKKLVPELKRLGEE